ncbi:MAG: HAD-IIB family hydrolase [Acidobacteria bacterium]|nr:HAD-IIB family hydrolase [Acidobacteriota bacterium]
MTIRLLALDIDGTLLDSRSEISERTRRTIGQVAAAGIPIVLVTGRRFVSARKVAQELNLTTPLISHNGALTKNVADLTTIDFRPLSRAIAARFVRVARSAGRDAVCNDDPYGSGQGVIEGISKHNHHLIQYVSRPDYPVHTVSDLMAYLDHDPIQMSSLGGYDAMHQFSRALHDEIGSAAKVFKTAYADRDMMFVDMVDASASKAAALAAVARHYGISPGEVMAVGDNHNDLEMLEFSGTGVLMGNAEEPLKQGGFYLTGTNDEDGLAQAIDRFVFRRPGGG